jgi:hypothetical protein
LLAVALLLPSAGQSQLIATVAQPTPLDAYRGRVLWSEPSPTGFRLVEYRNGTARQLPVEPASVPFEVDLGPDRRGRAVAVYSRCTQAPSYLFPAPLGCDLYRYDFKRARETAIRSVNTAEDEGYPAFWKGKLGFTRGDRFYWRWLSSRGRSRPLGKPHPDLSPSGMDLRGRLAAIAFVDTVDGGRLELVRIGGRTLHSEYTISRDISIGSRFVYWLALWGDRYNGYSLLVSRYDRDKGWVDRALVPSLARFAQDGATSYYVALLDPNCPGRDSPYGVYRATDLPL